MITITELGGPLAAQDDIELMIEFVARHYADEEATKHLEGRHDQSSHGSWASGGGAAMASNLDKDQRKEARRLRRQLEQGKIDQTEFRTRMNAMGADTQYTMKLEKEAFEKQKMNVSPKPKAPKGSPEAAAKRERMLKKADESNPFGDFEELERQKVDAANRRNMYEDKISKRQTSYEMMYRRDNPPPKLGEDKGKWNEDRVKYVQGLMDDDDQVQGWKIKKQEALDQYLALDAASSGKAQRGIFLDEFGVGENGTRITVNIGMGNSALERRGGSAAISNAEMCAEFVGNITPQDLSGGTMEVTIGASGGQQSVWNWVNMGRDGGRTGTAVDIEWGTYGSPSSVAHELGHDIEFRFNLTPQSVAFVRSRVPTGNLLGDTNSYKRKEVADAFTTPWRYAAKMYEGPYRFQQFYSLDDVAQVNVAMTELISSGVERLFKQPVKFANDDPEWFDFMITNLGLDRDEVLGS